MDRTQKIDKISLLTNEKDTSLLECYLDFANEIILSHAYPFGYPEGTEVPFKYDMLSIEIAIELYHRRGGEGEISNSQGGVSRSYENATVSQSLLSRILPCVKVWGAKNETT